MNAPLRLVYFNHNKRSLPCEASLAAACKALGIGFSKIPVQPEALSEMDFKKWFGQCQLAVLHTPPLIRGDNGNTTDVQALLLSGKTDSQDGLVVIFISGHPLAVEKKRVEFGQGKARYVINVAQTTRCGLALPIDEGGAKQWQELLRALLDRETVREYVQEAADIT